MRFTPRFALVLFAVVALPALACAGPIQWGYRAEGPNGLVLREVSGLTELAWSDYFMPPPKQFGTKRTESSANSSLTTDIWRYEATVRVIDELSGDSGSLPIFLEYVEQYEIKPDGSLYPVFEGTHGGPFWPDAARLELGGNVYRMRMLDGEMLMHIEPGPPLQSPEPGTLALAGLGFGAVLLRRRAVRGAVVALLVCAGLFGSTGTASAGPIEWDYVVRIEPDGRYLRIGTVPGPGGEWEVAAPLFNDFTEGPGRGAQRVRVGALIGQAAGRVPTDVTRPTEFDATLIITDRRSGESGQVSVLGRGRYLGDDQLADPKVALELLSERSHALELGANRYEIEFSTSQFEGDGASYLWADVTGSPVATPEPGTLALAGFGFGAVLLRRRASALRGFHRGDR
jgi:hypothetical protein